MAEIHPTKLSIRQPRRDLTGQRFGRLIVAEYLGAGRWRCLCDCGTEKDVARGNLTNGHALSCRCLQREDTSKRRTIHGEYKNDSVTAEMGIYRGMLDRCNNPRNRGYYNYGGRGIQVCERWGNDFRAFLLDMGRRPSPRHSIDRIDNDGNYEPGNCRWATSSEQCRNTRVSRQLTFNGQTRTMIEWSEIINVPYRTLAKRLYDGWTVERALTTPARSMGKDNAPLCK